MGMPSDLTDRMGLRAKNKYLRHLNCLSVWIVDQRYSMPVSQRDSSSSGNDAATYTHTND